MKSTMHGDEIYSEVKETGEEVAYSPLMETLARIGFGARGLIYFVMGVIDVQVATGAAHAPADQQGALAAISAQPVGKILLLIVLVGLVGYTLWGLIRVIFDPLHLGKDAKGFVQRLWFLTSAFTYGSLIFPTYNLLNGSGGSAQNGQQTAQTQQSVTPLLSSTGGQWLVGILGLISLGIGFGQVFQGLSRKFDKQFELYRLNPRQRVWIRRLGRFGTVARGITFGLIGAFLIISAVRADPSQAQGIDGALLKLAQLPYGPWLLGIVAVGLIAFGIYSMSGVLWFRLDRER